MANSAGSKDSDNCIERQKDEVKALQSIFASDFIDLRTEISNQPAMFKIRLLPRGGASRKEVHVKVELFIQYKPDYPKSVPIIDVKNDKGLSSEQISTLKKILEEEAEKCVGEETVFMLTSYIQEYLEDHNIEKPSSFYDEMVKNQRKQEAAKATNEKKMKDNILIQEQKKNKKIEDEAKRRHEAIRKKMKKDNSSDDDDDDEDLCHTSFELVSSESLLGCPSNTNRKANIPDINVQHISSKEPDGTHSSNDCDLHFLQSKTSRIARDFDILTNLGEGAFGYVIKVKNKLDDRFYAIKIIDSKHNSKLFKNITTEVKLLSRLNHENIVRYYNSWIEEDASSPDESKNQTNSEEDEESSYSLSQYVCFEDTDKDECDDDDEEEDYEDLQVDSVEEKHDIKKRYLCIQMEYCEKSTLKICIEKNLYKDVNRVWRLFRELLDALAHIHEQGIIHRDLKPGNIFLDSNDHIKIGDFGLARIHKPKPQQTVTLSEADTFQNDSCLMSSLTTDIGTFFYKSPEVSSSSGNYDQQVDMYSLGIIFFEMCYTRMETGMERCTVLTNLRKKDIIFPDNFGAELENQKQIIQILLNHEPECRPTSKELLQSNLLPLVEIEAKTNMILSSAISNSKSKTYKYMVESFFNQKYDEVCDIMYDDEVFKPCSVKHSLLQKNIIDTMTKIFCQHGAIRISTPLLMPKNEIHSARTPTFMDQNGQLVCLANNLKVPLIRYVKRRNIHNLKRYNIDRIFIGKTHGLHPKEFLECSFDIITPTINNLLPESEIIYLIEEIINEFNELKARNFSIVMNHTSILKAVLIYCGVSESKHEEILHLVERQGEKTKHIQNALEELNVSEQKISSFIKILKLEGSMEDIEKNLHFLTKCKGEVHAYLKQGFKELKEILSYCQILEIKLPIIIKLKFLRCVNLYSGIFFEVRSFSKKRTLEILAIGGRFDKLMSDYTVPLYTKLKSTNPRAVGVNIALDYIVTILNKEQHESVKRCEYMVCAYPDKSSSKSLLKKIHSLWSKKKSATLVYETVQSLDKIEKQCKVEGINNVIIIKDPHNSKEMLIEDTKWKKKSTKGDYSELLSEVDIKSRSQNASFKIIFLNRNIKRSLENQILKVLTSNLKWTPSNFSEVNVLVVDLPSSSVKEIVARIEITNDKVFNESIESIYDTFGKGKRKYLQDLCEQIREIRFLKGSHNIILYTIKDHFFKII